LKKNASKPEIVLLVKQAIQKVSLGAHCAEQLADDKRLIADLNLDSLDYATVLLSCENTLGIKIREDGIDWRRVASVSELADLLFSQQ